MKKEIRKNVEQEIASAITAIFSKMNVSVAEKFKKHQKGPVKELVKKFAKHIKSAEKEKAPLVARKKPAQRVVKKKASKKASK